MPGELYIGGAQLARGYLNAPDQTAEKFIANAFSSVPGSRLYKTGDLARYLVDGDIDFLGRVDHQVKIHGFRIETAEIEAALIRHTSVHKSLVMVAEDQSGRKRLIAYVVAPNGSPQLKDELRSHLKEALPAFMVPAAFVILDRLPLLPNGKIDRRALPAPDDPVIGRGQYLAPREGVQQLLVDIWSQVLGIERIGVNDNFFEIGGDSILSILIIAKANQQGVRLTPRDLFEHQTVAELAAAAGQAQPIEAEQGIVTGPVPLTPIQTLFFERGLPQRHHFNQSVMLETGQPINLECLRLASRKLLEHHDALRLRFFQADSEWRQWEAGLEDADVVAYVDVT
ncbi:MAG: phosphopantetheine-binding protein, partial [Blastocatellia bacterium]